MDHLKITAAHLIGHSMGGRIALSLAQNFPGRVKSLVMAASGSGPAARPGSDCIPGLPHRLVLDMVEMGFEKFIYDEIVESDTFFTKDYRDRHRDKVEAFYKLAWATHSKLPEFIHLCMARHNFEGTHRLGDVKAPVLVLIGEADTIGSNHIAQSKVLLERIPSAEMKVLKNQSHGFFWQAPDETNQVILNWVKRHA
jgi:pimeloyl-ACP methyl ester carboxylesterase